MILGFFSSLSNILLGLLAFIFVLGTIVLIHEGGHFYFARKANVLCREYSFGMGPILVHKKKGETDYQIRALPIGGFCAIAGEEREDDPLLDKKQVRLVIENNIVKKICVDSDNQVFSDIPMFDLVKYDLYDANQTSKLFIAVKENDKEVTYDVDPQAMYLFADKVASNESIPLDVRKKKHVKEIQIAPYNRQLNSKSLGKRAMVIFGGPMMNMILAIVVFFISSLIMGVSNHKTTVLSKMAESSPSYIAGLRQNDEVYRLTSAGIDSGVISEWQGISDFMDEYRDNSDINGNITVYYYENGDRNNSKSVEVKPIVMIYSISMLQDVKSDEVKIGPLAEKSKAYKAGLREGDVITKINGIDISSWKEVYNEFAKVHEANTEVKVTVSRTVNEVAETKEFTVIPYSEKIFKETQNVKYVDIQLGISPALTRNVFKCFKNAFVEMYQAIKQLFKTLGLLIGSNT